MAKKKRSIEDKIFPVAVIPKLGQTNKPPENPDVIKKIIQAAVKSAYQKKTPSAYDIKYGDGYKVLISEEQVQFVSHLIETLQPADSIEAALAAQFVVTFIRGMEISTESNSALEMGIGFFRFGHEALETLTKYRTKGAQLISVQYNHTQAVNTFNLNKAETPPTIEV